jgi:ATP-dependent helicase Lhr and Lhr-like helicase
LSNKTKDTAKSKALKWFAKQGWEVHAFQKAAIDAYLAGKGGLVNAPTGSGKTYSLAIPSIVSHNPKKKGIHLLWITPLRSLATEIQEAIATAANSLDCNWHVAIRNGDTSTKERTRQKKEIPQCLVTTPESLHLLLAQKKHDDPFKNLDAVVVDEWHELLGSKRGVQTELAISRLKHINPKLKVWGISATIGNLQQAMEVLVPNPDKRVLIKSNLKKEIQIETIMPDEVEEFPWAGHLGIKLLDKVLPIIEQSKTTLIFTNTRSQSELWYQYILEANPALGGVLAMHHGSLDRELREWVEQALESGYLKAVVCTSSLDLGVDFRPVDTVIQIGSPKGVARFVQRAGRSGHAPGLKSKIYFLPTHALEMVEAAALKEAVANDIVEERIPVVRAFDVLVQYAITLAVGDGFDSNKLFEEVRGTHAFADIDEQEWAWVMSFVVTGGPSLASYNEYKKVEYTEGLYKVMNRKIAMQHRLSIGTIEFDSSLNVAFLNGKRIGSIEEYFISRLNNGDVFFFSGRTLELIKVEGVTAFVRNGNAKKKAVVPSWNGGRMSLTSEISDLLRKQFNKPWVMENNPEMQKLAPLFQLQSQLSTMPRSHQLLIEKIESEDGHHLFVFPFEGRMIHEGMGMLLAFRWSQMQKSTISVACNDYGFELLSDQPIDLPIALENDWFGTDKLEEHLYRCTNYSEIARRRFSNIANVAGLMFKGYPHKLQKSRHLQASASLFFQVFKDYDNQNLLYKQAFEEALYNQLDAVRLRRALNRIKGQEIIIKETSRFTPFAFPIMVDRLREQMSNEKLNDRIRKMIDAK